ncbi:MULTISPECIES: hypothetical protein [Citrobacter freundii complex]|uniref:hypothetical protein n=1 Tax=Citrobacter freundii complex TaxID=1344959 RepID=UPI0005390E5F|nr:MULTISPECIES: hypothetical protein [Citrobacter freundii complex]MDT3760497.1 hypothetical protein [Citrobacter freundii complex sp. 2023EL-00962]QAR65986.1 hypothetical protein C3B53_15930 [Citrobacter sp. SL156]AUU26440.1 hypothetical protein MC62_010870 [Citrobacter freundii]EJA2537234.1 hypothetical protein [Citrobacter freundii]EJC1961358.1 hypothetical protein [Citrobacter freundii]
MSKTTQQTVTQSTQVTFPDYFPSGVPPKEAIDASGEFYRLTKAKPPGKDCFLNMRDENPKRMGRFKGLSLKCCYGVSVYTEEQSLVNAFDKFPEGVGERFIAKGTLESADGVMLKTGAPDSTHFTIWIGKDAEIHKKFSCIRGLVK